MVGPVLTIDDLDKHFGPTVALDGVSLTVAPGEMVGFVGANGAGKSTAMRIAMGLLTADAGRVRWQGAPVTRASRRRFGYLPEERGLYPKMRIADQIAYVGRLYGLGPAAAQTAALRLLDTLAVAAAPTDPVNALSLGNQQRVQLATALVHDPELLVLDEPFSGLDPVAVDVTAAVLQERRAAGVGVLFSSHQLDLVERLCDRVVIIRAGRVVAAGTLEQLRAAAGPAELDVTVAAAAPDWPDRVLATVPGARVVLRDGDLVRLTLDRATDDQQVLTHAAAAGRVVSFGWRRPPLTELYREAVTDPAVAA